MVEQGTLEGEAEDAWRRFWALSWRVKAAWLACALVVVILLGLAGAVAGEPAPPGCPTATGDPTDPGAFSDQC